jgi:hypothetical protein
VLSPILEMMIPKRPIRRATLTEHAECNFQVSLVF